MKTYSLLIILILTLPSFVSADEEQPFFGRDFAKSPDQDSYQPIETTATLPTNAPTILPVATKSSSEDLSERVRKIAEGARSKDSNVSLPAQSTPLPGSKQTMKIAVVGAILDATNQQLLIKQLVDFVTIARELHLTISTIYCIGPRIELPANTLYEIAKQQGRLLFVDEQPQKYQAVKQSPTWILSSLDQEIIIEGAGLLSENINLKGEITTRATEKITPQR